MPPEKGQERVDEKADPAHEKEDLEEGQEGAVREDQLDAVKDGGDKIPRAVSVDVVGAVGGQESPGQKNKAGQEENL